MSRLKIIVIILATVFAPLASKAASAPAEVAASSAECSDTIKPRVNLQADVRVDFDYSKPRDADAKLGFYGRYLNVMLDVNISRKVSMSLRQRLNKFGEMRNDVFGATDWVYLNYSPTDRWTLSGGKQVVAIGGFEYDRRPIDVFYASMFWNNIACYQFGVSATYHMGNGSQNLLVQVCNSPYQTIGNSCLAYNLMWMGRIGRLSTLYSVNMLEYRRGHYANFVSLGHHLDLGKCYLELDFMNRYSGHQQVVFGDFTAIGKVCASVGKFDIFAKGGYDRFRPELGITTTVAKPFYGIGGEFFPLRKGRNLRVHLVADVTHDSHTGERYATLSAGLTWRVTLINK